MGRARCSIHRIHIYLPIIKVRRFSMSVDVVESAEARRTPTNGLSRKRITQALYQISDSRPASSNREISQTSPTATGTLSGRVVMKPLCTASRAPASRLLAGSTLALVVTVLMVQPMQVEIGHHARRRQRSRASVRPQRHPIPVATALGTGKREPGGKLAK